MHLSCMNTTIFPLNLTCISDASLGPEHRQLQNSKGPIKLILIAHNSHVSSSIRSSKRSPASPALISLCVSPCQTAVNATTTELLRKQEELEKKARELERRERELESHTLGTGACKTRQDGRANNYETYIHIVFSGFNDFLMGCFSTLLSISSSEQLAPVAFVLPCGPLLLPGHQCGDRSALSAHRHHHVLLLDVWVTVTLTVH